jgi:hypothetical protein
MVAIKRYGPVTGAGTTITEKLAEITITPSPLGVVAWSGIMEKGPTDELIEIFSKQDLARQIGSRTPDSYLPICAEDFWDSSRGAGQMYLSRVTDGTERVASLILYSRETSGSGFGRWRNIMTIDAKSGGRWAGAYNRRIGEMATPATDLTETTIDTGLTLLEDEFKSGTVVLTELPNDTFVITGNTTAGIVTVKSDSQMKTKYDASGGADDEFVLFKDNTDTYGKTKKIAILLKDGARDPANEFGMEVYWNNEPVLDYDNLSLDSSSDVYFVNVINDDTGNFEIFVTDNFTGTVAALARPANQAGQVPTAGLTTTTLTLEWYQYYADSANTGDGSISAVTVRANTQKDLITLECNSITVPGSETWTVTTTNQDGTLADATSAVAYTFPNAYGADFTITVGATPWAVGDKLYIMLEPIIPAEAIGGQLYYNTTDDPFDSLEISDATVSTVDVPAGNDLSALSAVGKGYRLQYKEGLTEGYDGHAGVVDSDYSQTFDAATSLFNQLLNKQLGLIKFAIPGVVSATVQKAGRAYAAANNSCYRHELPVGTTTETGAVDWMINTAGTNDFAQVIMPSWYSIADPDQDTGLIQIPNTGAVQGYEAFSAYSWQGYHKAAAGTSAVLEKTEKLPTGKKVLNQEITNRHGIQVVLKKGNWVIWGDRCPATPTGLKFKHKREQLSHYERVLFENYDWIIFAINDEDLQDIALAALKAYFIPEWRPKRALRGNTFEEAASINVGNEINTNATRAAGDLNAEIKLRLAETAERFNIVVSPAGIFEKLG